MDNMSQIFKKQVNIEFTDRTVYNHLKAQPHMAAYIAKLIRHDMAGQETVEKRLETMEQAVRPLHIKISGIEFPLGAQAYRYTETAHKDILQSFQFGLLEAKLGPYLSRLCNGECHRFALNIDEGYFVGTALVESVSDPPAMPFRLQFKSVDKKWS